MPPIYLFVYLFTQLILKVARQRDTQKQVCQWLVYFPDAFYKPGQDQEAQTKLNRGLPPGWQDPAYFNQSQMSSRICIGKKVTLEV